MYKVPLLTSQWLVVALFRKFFDLFNKEYPFGRHTKEFLWLLIQLRNNSGDFLLQCCIFTIAMAPPAKSFCAMGHASGEDPWASGSKMAPFDQTVNIYFNAIEIFSSYISDTDHKCV